MKRIRHILVLLLLLSLPALACNLLLGQPTPTPVPTDTPAPTNTPAPVATDTPEPAPTPEVAANFVDYENESEGVSLAYPEDWHVDDAIFVMIASNEDLLSGPLDFSQGAVLILFTGDLSEIGSSDPIIAIDTALQEFDVADDAEVVEGPTALTINGQNAASVVVTGTSRTGRPFTAIYAVIMGVERAAVVVAAMPSDVTITATGDYFVVVTGHGGSTGNYELTLSESGARAAGALGLDAPGDDDDELLRSVDTSFGTETLAFEVPADGNYYFLVKGYNGQAGDYTIFLEGPPDVIFELAVGDLVNGQLDDSAFIDYTIRGARDNQVIVAVTSDAALDAVIETFDLDDNLLASADRHFADNTEELIFTFPADRRYIIRVRGFANAVGGYLLTIEAGN